MSDTSDNMEKQNSSKMTSIARFSDKKETRPVRNFRDGSLQQRSLSDTTPSARPYSSGQGNFREPRHQPSGGGQNVSSTTHLRRPAREVNGGVSRNSGGQTNANNLLGFYFDDDYGATSDRKRGAARMTRPPPKLWRSFNSRRTNYDDDYGSSYFNKEQFIQANCQFVVPPSVDTSAHLIDPDILVNWDQVLQVRIMSHEVPQCPICLSPPVAPRMTRCGHIYCWPCALQYLAYENENTSKKCAICAEEFYPEDLKSVVAKSTQNFKVNDTLSMVLMRREKGFTQALPYAPGQHQMQPPEVGQSQEEDQAFAKLVVCGPHQLSLLLDSDMADLVVALDEERSAGDVSTLEVFLCRVIEQLRNQIESLQEMGQHQEKRAQKQLQVVEEELSESTAAIAPATATIAYKDAFTNEEADVVPPVSVPISRPEILKRQDMCSRTMNEVALAAAPVLDPPGSDSSQDSPAVSSLFGADGGPSSMDSDGPVRRAKKTSLCEETAFYFYQASEGQHIYLHSLNWKCLAAQYGVLENWPPKITARILQIEHLTVSAAIRKRYRYLSHLPLTCSVSVVELDLGPPLVSRDILAQFEGQLKRRRQERRERDRQDKWLTKRKEIEENSFLGLQAGMRMIPSGMSEIEKQEKLVAEFDETDFMPLSRSDQEKSAVSPLPQPSDKNSGQIKSFAAMLKTAHSTPPVSSSSCVHSSPTWPLLPSSLPSTRGDVDSDPEMAEYTRPTSNQTSLGETLGCLLDARLSLNHTSPGQTASGGGKKSGKKGRRGKSIVLFST